MCEISIQCLLMYSLLGAQTTSARNIGAFWLLVLIGQTVVISIAAIAVNTQV